MAIVFSHHFGIEYLRNLRSTALQRPETMEDWLSAPQRGLQRIASGNVDLACGRPAQHPNSKNGTSIVLPSAEECNRILRQSTTPTRNDLDRIKARVPLLARMNAFCHVVVPETTARQKRSYAKAHVLGAKLWDGALWHICDDVYVCSPELLFVQMANVLPRPILVRLGMELCGGYCIQPQNSSGFDNVYAVTTPAKLSECINKMRALTGKREAQAMVSHVQENSASPAETDVYIVLCFPRTEGGYFLPKPILNGMVEIELPGGKTRYRFCDFLWGQSLAAEYYGKDSHGNQSAFLNDATRQAELAMRGIQVIPITAEQTGSIRSMDCIAESIGKNLGIRKRRKLPDFEEKQLELHSLLFPWAH